MRRLGLTGGIGSGKSFVARLLAQRFGVPVYSCDERAKWLMLHDGQLRASLAELVGARLYDSQGCLDKAVMSAFLFASPAHTQAVNQLVHPAVRADFHRWLRQEVPDAAAVAMESAILYESGFQDEVDEVIFVDAPEALRIHRAMQRDGLTEEQVRQRICRQQTRQAKARATWCLTNGEAETADTLVCQLEATTRLKPKTPNPNPQPPNP